MSKRPFYRFVNQSDSAIAEVQIVDFIGDWLDDYWGFGVTAKSFIDELARLPDAVKTIRVRINSPGGDVFAALNIANALRAQRAEKGRSVETIVDGIAASAATLVLMAGDPVRIADNSLLMIHNPTSGAYGNATHLREGADTLDKVRDTIVSTYQWHVNMSDDELITLMDAETWMDAAEAIESGFANEVIEGLQAAALIDPRAMARLEVPERFRDRVQSLLTPEPSPAPGPAPSQPTPSVADAHEVLRLCREGDVLDMAESLLGQPEAEVRDAVDAAVIVRRAEVQRRDEITALCAHAKLPELATSYIDGGMPAARVREQIAVVTARLDVVEIDAGLAPADGGRSHQPIIDVRAIYRERNRLPQRKE
jgi:ATP-dependent protease ClpP protease subunit